MSTVLDDLAVAFGITWFNYQRETFAAEEHTDSAELRVCLYYRTGAGKTFTALALLRQAGVTEALIVAPLRTHPQWRQHAEKAGVQAHMMTPQKYRMKATKVPKLMPVIIDEFHMLGGHGGVGFKKVQVHSRWLQAPLIVLSATPNYNDEERVYCVQYALDPIGSKGGYIEWIYQNCKTRVNMFGKEPLVDGWLDGRTTVEHLASLPHVYYVEDPHADFDIEEIVLPTSIPDELAEYGIDWRHGRIVASQMEYVSSSRKHQLLDDAGDLRVEVWAVLERLLRTTDKPVMVFCARAEIARAGHTRALREAVPSGCVTYAPNPKQGEATLQAFKDENLDVLFGTATMSTGVDGLDKVCDMLVLLDDTDDASLRRQVIGRILPRGDATDVSSKRVVRLVLGDS